MKTCFFLLWYWNEYLIYILDYMDGDFIACGASLRGFEQRTGMES